MAIQFSCSCGRQLRARDESAGKAFRCPACAAMVVVPGGSVFVPRPKAWDDPAPADYDVGPTGDDQPSPAQPPAPSTPFYLNPVIIIGVVFPAMVLGWFGWYLWSERQHKARREAILAVKAEADGLFGGEPERASARYGDLLDLIPESTTDPDEKRWRGMAEGSRKSLEERIRPIVEARKAKAEAQAKLKEMARKVEEIAAKRASIRASLAGRAWTERKSLAAIPARGVTVYVIKGTLPRSKLSPVLDYLESDPVVGEIAGNLKGLPDDQPIELKPIWAQIRVASGAGRGTDVQKYDRLREDKIWPMVVEEATVKRADTDIDGKYELRGLAGGQYFAYAMYGTDSAFIEWIVPLDIDKADEFRQDFHNNNAAVIQNKRGD